MSLQIDQNLSSPMKIVSHTTKPIEDALTSSKTGKPMLLKTLVLSACLSALSLSVFAGAGSGGGGVVYKTENGKILTLPEFGVLIEENYGRVATTGKRYDEYYQLSEEAIAEIAKISAKVHNAVPGIYISTIRAPYPKGLIRKKNVDPVEYKRIKNEYKKVLEAFNYKLQDEKFILPALTLSGKTFIFPDFEALSPIQQAKIIIHENNMKSDDTDRLGLLKKTLKLDTIIEKILSDDILKVDRFQLLKMLRIENLISNEVIVGNIIQMMGEELKRPVELKELFPDFALNLEHLNLYDFYSWPKFEIDPSDVQDFQDQMGLKRNYAEMLEGTAFKLEIISSSSSKGKKCAQEDISKVKILFDGSLSLQECTSNYLHYPLSLVEIGPFIQKFSKK